MGLQCLGEYNLAHTKMKYIPSADFVLLKILLLNSPEQTLAKSLKVLPVRSTGVRVSARVVVKQALGS